MPLKKFAIRSDMEGLSGIVRTEDVNPSGALYEKSRAMLHHELAAICEGLFAGGADYVEIYDEHYFGLNVQAFLLPSKVKVINGKPPYTVDWLGGIDRSYAGMILQGYHAMAGTKGGILPHTYEPDIAAIWINGTLVGEIGVEAAIAGEAGVPLVLLVGDSHGAFEASELVPGVETVVVKEGMGDQRGICRNWPDIRQEIIETSARLVSNPPKALPLQFASPVELILKIHPGVYRSKLSERYVELFLDKERLRFAGTSVAGTWATYWMIKDDILCDIAK